MCGVKVAVYTLSTPSPSCGCCASAAGLYVNFTHCRDQADGPTKSADP